MAVVTVWSRLTRVVLLLVMAAGALLVAVSYLPLIRQNQAIRENLQQVQTDVRIQEELGNQKRAAIEALRNDPVTVERLAREKLGLSRTGETVVHFEPPALVTRSNAPAIGP